MPVIGGNNPTATVTVPVPTPAPMKKPKQTQQPAAPQPVPNNPRSQQQDVPQGMSPVPMVPQLPEPRAIILPWAPPPSGTPRSVMRKMRVRYAAKPSPWYSHALRVIEEKVPNRATAEQIRKTLINNGVKPDELKWGGIDAFLGWNPFTISSETHGPPNRISKADLLEHVRQSGIKFTEKTYGTVKPRPESERDTATVAEQQAEEALAAVSKRLLSTRDQMHLTNRKISDLTVSKEPFSQVRLVGNNGFRNRPATRFDAVRYVPREVRGRLVWTKDRTLASGTPRELHNRGYEDQSYGGIHNQILTANDLQEMKEHQERQEMAKNPESQQELERLKQEQANLLNEHNRILAEQTQAKKAVDAARRKRVGANKPKGTPTRYGPDSEYNGGLTIPGGSNYKETTVHLPEHMIRDAEIGRAQDGGGVGREFKSGHFPGKNILYHIRYNDFNTPDGRKLLHLDEIQSDLAHASGYDHPYKKNWHELALRKVLNHAVANGYDGISWTPGRMQADRYNLGKIVDQIQYRFGQHNPGETPATVIIRPRHAGTGKLFEEIKTSPQDLHQYVGREHAVRIMNGESDPNQTFTSGFGNEWKVLPIDETHMGGEHHKRLYDQMIPQYLNKIGKQHGATVGTSIVPAGTSKPTTTNSDPVESFQEVHSFEITPKLRQAIKSGGQALYSRKRLRYSKRSLRPGEIDQRTGARMRVRYEKSGKLGKRDWQPEDDNAIAPEEGLYDESPSSPSESGPAGSHVQGWQLLGGKVHKKFKVLSVKDKSGKITRRLEIAPKGDKSARSILRVKFKGKGAVYEYYFADPDEAKSYLNKLRRSSHPGKVVWELRDATPEYKRVYGRVNEDYRGEHTAPDSTSGAPLHDVTTNGVYPEDVYSPQGLRYYNTGDDRGDAEMHAKINRLRGKPKKMILIYRAIPHGLKGAKINRGDWVTLSKKYAMDHGRSALNGKYRILTKIANAEDVYTNGDSWHEWGYDPPKGREQSPEQMSRKYAKMESGLSPDSTPQPPIEMWHGSRRWDGNPEVRAPKKGRYEAGPGIYMTTNFQTAQRYAKGGGSTMLFHLDPSLKFAHDVLIPKHEAIGFVKSAKGIRNRDKIILDIESNSNRRNSDSVSAEVINNLFVNHEAASGNAGLQLVDFLKSKGVDAIFHPHSSQEHWIALINPKKVLKWSKMASKDVPIDRYNLPMVKKYSADDGLDFGMDAMNPEGTESPSTRSREPVDETVGRRRKQILMQILEAAKKGHYDPAGMTPRDYIREMESPKDIEPGQGQVWMSDPEDELLPDEPQSSKQYNRKVTYPHLSRMT